MFNWDLWFATLHQYSLWLMFVSAFLSATVLPGNSEIVFISLATAVQLPAKHYISLPMVWLLLSAIAGNSLGSFTTYWLGRCFPKFDPLQQNSRKLKWTMQKIERHGVLVLLFSWLPVVGDIFCALAGWLRLDWRKSGFYIVIGKTLRYLFLLYLVIGYTFL